jgi:predicted esterase
MRAWSEDAPVCLLHGLGSGAEEFRRHWGAVGRRWRFLEGPEVDRLTGGRRWFPFSGMASTLAAGIQRAAEEVENTLADLDDCILAGHSQGAMIGLELLRRGHLRVRSVWSFSGFLPAPLRVAADPWPRTGEVHLFWSRADRFVDPTEVEATAEFLAALPGSRVHRHVAGALPHTFSSEWLDDRNFEHDGG